MAINKNGFVLVYLLHCLLQNCCSYAKDRNI